MSAILIVEDDENLRVALEDNLQSEGYDVATAANGQAAERAVAARRPDLVVLDLMLPDTDGYTLCRKLRPSVGAILMLTARTLEEDLVRGFEAGADDYLAKPYRLRELLARVKALLRRGPAAERETHVTFGPFTLDVEARAVAGGGPIDLTRTEFDLLATLLRNRGRVLSRNEILDAVWGADVHVDARTVDNFVLSLRKKLRWEAASRFEIATVRGVGYRMTVE